MSDQEPSFVPAVKPLQRASGADQLSVLQSVFAAIAASRDARGRVEAALSGAARIASCAEAWLALRQADNKLRYQYAFPLGRKYASAVQTSGIVAKAAEQRRPILNSAFGMAVDQLVAAVPLIHQGDLLGVLVVSAPLGPLPDESDLLVLEMLGQHLALSLANARLATDLDSEKALLLTTLQSMSDALIVLDKTGNVLLANAAADKIFGLPLTAGSERNLLALLAASPLPLRFRGNDQAEIAPVNVFANGKSFHGELDAAQAEPQTFSVAFTPIRRGGQKLIGSVAIFHDVTESRRLEQLKSDFISTVSHEMRTPLTAIKGLVKLVLEEELGPLTERQHEALAVTDGEADRLEHMIQNLLNISSIEAGQTSVNLEYIEPAELFQSVAQSMAERAKASDIDLRLELAPGLPLINGDSQMIGQVLTHLLDNALKFTPAGGSIVVTATAEAPLLVVKVRDSGIGIPEHLLDRIFARFYQVNPGVGRGGAGLGLAIARQLVEMHGGQIFASSMPDHGSTFVFTLPLWQRETARFKTLEV